MAFKLILNDFSFLFCNLCFQSLYIAVCFHLSNELFQLCFTYNITKKLVSVQVTVRALMSYDTKRGGHLWIEKKVRG